MPHAHTHTHANTHRQNGYTKSRKSRRGRGFRDVVFNTIDSITRIGKLILRTFDLHLLSSPRLSVSSLAFRCVFLSQLHHRKRAQ